MKQYAYLVLFKSDQSRKAQEHRKPFNISDYGRSSEEKYKRNKAELRITFEMKGKYYKINIIREGQKIFSVERRTEGHEGINHLQLLGKNSMQKK